MPSLVPPSKSIIDNMKDAIDKAKAFTINLSDKMEISSINNFFIFDDDNELIHAIAQNSDMTSQAYAPYQIRSFTYNSIEFFRYLV